MAQRITRKQFLLGAGAVGSAAVLRPFRARAARPTVIKLGLAMALDHPVTKHLIVAAGQIKKETNGEVVLQVFPNNELGNDTHTLADVRSGAMQMMALGDNILATLVPSAAVDNVGFAFKDAKAAFAALDGAVGEIVRSDIVKHGLQPMPAIWDLGLRQVANSTRPIRTPEDLRGLKIRVPESPSSFSLFKDLGAAPVAMNSADTYTALQTHVLDGTAIDLSSLETLKFYQVQKYCSLTNHMWIGYWMLMNGPLWNRLPRDHQKVIAAVFDAEGLKERVVNEAFNNSLQGTLTSQGLTFNKTDPAPFKAMLVKHGFYSYWQKKLGSELWSALEKYSGALA
ncbi:MAG: TRAP transporter substrate-binding protein [Acetobacteraceae bacterium]